MIVMRRIMVLLSVSVLLSILPGCGEKGGDTVFDKMGDSAAVMGKEDPEKSIILAERRAKRAAERAGKALERTSNAAQKEMKKLFGE